nr:MAG TPA: hypothetical protein [Caudoviricetes sp.]
MSLTLLINCVRLILFIYNYLNFCYNCIETKLFF